VIPEVKLALADQNAQKGGGVNRRQFLAIAGLGFLAGIAAMLLLNRWRRGGGSSPRVSTSDDSMYRPRDGGERQA
jgi:hypothetical protein